MKKLFVTSLVVLMLFVSSIGVFAADPDSDIVETAIEAEDFNTLVDAVIAADLVEALKAEGPFTVFAPTDEAFENLPEGLLEKLLDNPDILAKVLLYHVVEGEVLAEDVLGLDGEQVETLQGQTVEVEIDNDDVLVNDAQVIETDIICTNGVIHVIDKVLIPEWDIVETAILNADFNTLVDALTAAGLVEALKSEGPFTVFAPTDEAFENLPEGLLEGLLEDTAALGNVLLYHVVDGKVMAADVLGLDGENVQTLLEQEVTITIENETVYVNDAMVIAADISCTNGVIHVIDAVLVPDLEEDEIIEPEMIEVVLSVGETTYTINGVENTMDAAPFIEEDLTFVPVRFIGEAFDLQADWGPKDALTEWVTFGCEDMDILIEIEIGSPYIQVTEGGVTRTEEAEVAAQIVDERTYLPLRAVGEIFGAEFDWGPKEALTEWVSFSMEK